MACCSPGERGVEQPTEERALVDMKDELSRARLVCEQRARRLDHDPLREVRVSVVRAKRQLEDDLRSLTASAETRDARRQRALVGELDQHRRSTGRPRLRSGEGDWKRDGRSTLDVSLER